jgi:heat shock protein HslJ
MNVKRYAKNMMMLAAMLIMLFLAACAPTTEPTDVSGNSNVDENSVVDGVETAVSPPPEPETPTDEPETPNEPELDVLDITWILQTMAGQAVIQEVDVTIEFKPDGQFSGVASCNNYFGSYQLDGRNLTLSGVGNTEMWCEGLMDQESAFLSMLLSATGLAVDDNQLTIATTEGELVFADANSVATETEQVPTEESVVEIAPVDEVKDTLVQEPVIPGRYIVMLDPTLFNEAGETADGKTLDDMANELVAQTGGRLSSTLNIIDAFVVEGLTEQDVAMFENDRLVISIEADRIVSIDPIETTDFISEKTVFVGAEQVDCVGVGPQKCLLVKEDANAEWGFYYDEIAGFTWEPGFEYEIRVRVDQVQNPPADGSSIMWTLIEVVAKTAVSN